VHAIAVGIPSVEVYTNLVAVNAELWEVFQLSGVSLATSWYSSDPGQHQRIVHRDTHAKTLANISRALELGIPIRVGLTDIYPEQNVEEALEQIRALGIKDAGIEPVTPVGRAAHGRETSRGDLCGRCTRRLVILPDGDVHPCVMASWPEMRAGNIRESSLRELLTGEPLAAIRRTLQAEFDGRPARS